jgi:hypothetical protein
VTANNRIFWLVVAATLGVYLVMVLWSIPRISAEAGGLPVFDLRPGGYTFEEARAFLAALSPEGARSTRRPAPARRRLSGAARGHARLVDPAPRAGRWGIWRHGLLAATAIARHGLRLPGKPRRRPHADPRPGRHRAGLVETASFHSQAKAGDLLGRHDNPAGASCNLAIATLSPARDALIASAPSEYAWQPGAARICCSATSSL